jgi:hypothetical protein
MEEPQDEHDEWESSSDAIEKPGPASFDKVEVEVSRTSIYCYPE